MEERNRERRGRDGELRLRREETERSRREKNKERMGRIRGERETSGR